MVASTRPPRRGPTPSEFPVSGDSTELVQLDPDHPGFRDQDYRRRRDAIAELALSYHEGDAIPWVEYTDEEHGIWRTIQRELVPLHDRYAVEHILKIKEAFALDTQRIPQLREVTERLRNTTGMSMLPVAGLVSTRAFLRRLAGNIFLSTQYMRHASRPLYTPEPDVVHELVGHAATLADPTFARLNRLFGQAAATASDEQMVGIGRVYWYTIEFGLALEQGVPKAYGAGLLSSFGEIQRFCDARLLDFDIEVVSETPYDPTDYQHTLFVASSFEALVCELERWLQSF